MTKTSGIRTQRHVTVIQLSLLPEIMDDVESYLVDWPKIEDFMADSAREGYRFSIGYNSEREQYSASMYGDKVNNENRKQQIYGNAPTFLGAVNVLYLKHFLCCKDTVWATGQTVGSDAYS